MVLPSANRRAAERRFKPLMYRCSRIWPWFSRLAFIFRLPSSPGSSMSRAFWDERDAVMPLNDAIRNCSRVNVHRPWPRVVADEQVWRSVAAQLRDGEITLSGLWGDAGVVHMAVLDETSSGLIVVSLECPDGCFPSVGQFHPPAIRLERAIHDLFGLTPDGSPDKRPWLDHGRWNARHPLGNRASPAATPPAYCFLQSEGEGLHQIPVW